MEEYSFLFVMSSVTALLSLCIDGLEFRGLALPDLTVLGGSDVRQK